MRAPRSLASRAARLGRVARVSALRALVALVLVAGSLTSASTWYRCLMMEGPQKACCCPGDDAPPPVHPTVSAASCCQSESYESSPPPSEPSRGYARSVAAQPVAQTAAVVLPVPAREAAPRRELSWHVAGPPILLLSNVRLC